MHTFSAPWDDGSVQILEVYPQGRRIVGLFTLLFTGFTMTSIRSLLALAAGVGHAIAASCPLGHTSGNGASVERRAVPQGTEDFMAKYTVNSSDTYMTSDAGGPMEDQNSLSAGERGPTLLEDFIFRQKITHFDHERVRSMNSCIEFVLIVCTGT